MSLDCLICLAGYLEEDILLHILVNFQTEWVWTVWYVWLVPLKKKVSSTRWWTFILDEFRFEDVSLVEFMDIVFTHMPGDSCRGRLRPLSLYLCWVFRALINSLVCWLFDMFDWFFSPHVGKLSDWMSLDCFRCLAGSLEKAILLHNLVNFQTEWV